MYADDIISLTLLKAVGEVWSTASSVERGQYAKHKNRKGTTVVKLTKNRVSWNINKVMTALYCKMFEDHICRISSCYGIRINYGAILFKCKVPAELSRSCANIKQCVLRQRDRINNSERWIRGKIDQTTLLKLMMLIRLKHQRALRGTHQYIKCFAAGY